MTEINAGIEINNQSSTEIEVLDVPSVTDENVTGVAYEEEVKLLSTQTGSPTIAIGETQTVELHDTDAQGEESTFYELLLAESTSLFPFKHSLIQYDVANSQYPVLTVSATDQQQTNLAYQYYQSVQAYITSTMVQNLESTLYQIIDEAQSATEINTLLTDYFQQNTTGYQTLDINALAAVVTYLETYACAWAGNQPNATYYLYKAIQVSPQERLEKIKKNPTVGITQAPQTVGKLILTQTTAATPNESSSGYEMKFQPADGTAEINLSYDRGQLVSDKTATQPEIALQTSFALQNQFTYVSTDTQLIRILAGRVNGEAVIGVTVDQSDAATGWYAFWNMGSLGGWFPIIGATCSLVLSIQALIVSVYYFFSQLTRNNLVAVAPGSRGGVLDGLRQKAKSLFDKKVEASEALLEPEFNSETVKVPADQSSTNTITNEIKGSKVFNELNERVFSEFKQFALCETRVETLVESGISNAELEEVNREIRAREYQLNGVYLDYIDAVEAKDLERITNMKDALTNILDYNHKTELPYIDATVKSIESKYDKYLSDAVKGELQEMEEAGDAERALEETVTKEETDVEDNAFDEENTHPDEW